MIVEINLQSVFTAFAIIALTAFAVFITIEYRKLALQVSGVSQTQQPGFAAGVPTSTATFADVAKTAVPAGNVSIAPAPQPAPVQQQAPIMYGILAQQPNQPVSGRDGGVPPGSTKDPKTGKVYKLVPKKARAAEFVQLESQYETARAALAEYNNTHGYQYDITQHRTISPDGTPVAGDTELVRLVREVGQAKTAMQTYKEGHKEQFAPPPKGGRGIRNKGPRGPTTKVVRSTPLGGGQASGPARETPAGGNAQLPTHFERAQNMRFPTQGQSTATVEPEESGGGPGPNQ